MNSTRIMLLALLLATIPVYLGIRTVDRNITDRLRQEALAQAEIDSQARIEFNLLHLGTLEVMRLKEARKAQEAIWQQASRGGDGVQRRYKWVTLEITAYSIYDKGVGDTTFSGLPVDKGVIATDPALIPVGSIIWLPGVGYLAALDAGGAIKGAKADVFMDRQSAIRFGRQRVKVKVLE